MSVVLLERLTTHDGRVVAEIKLNAPKTLNALNGEMIAHLHHALRECADDPDVVAVILDSAGEKAFCAGGDVVGLREACLAGDALQTATRFFGEEYRLDYAIHSYRKPIIAWGSGIVMGGGMGLLCGCSHRVVTESTMMAMPEITIGLYPDVGGSWFLNRLPGRTGLFVAVTGVRLNAADVLFLGLGNRFVESARYAEMLEQLVVGAWQDHDAHTVRGCSAHKRPPVTAAHLRSR